MRSIIKKDALPHLNRESFAENITELIYRNYCMTGGTKVRVPSSLSSM